MSIGCISLRCCLNGLVLCVGRAFRVYCARSEVECCVVAIVLMCVSVAHARLARFVRLDGSRFVCYCHRNTVHNSRSYEVKTTNPNYTLDCNS